jgi:isochorismate hydrolase
MVGIPLITEYPLPVGDRLPDNVARWSIDPDRAVLLVHDMQRYFLEPIPERTRKELIHNASCLRDRCAEQGIPVAYTAQPGSMSESDRGLLKDFWGPGMRAEEVDREIVDELAPRPGDWVFTKWRYSAFQRSILLEWMRAEGRDQLILCGVYAHVGVLATALDAFANDIQPFLVADALGDFSEADHVFALDYAARRCGVIVPAEGVLP